MQGSKGGGGVKGDILAGGVVVGGEVVGSRGRVGMGSRWWSWLDELDRKIWGLEDIRIALGSWAAETLGEFRYGWRSTEELSKRFEVLPSKSENSQLLNQTPQKESKFRP